MGLLDFFFPKKCVNCRNMGAYLCPSCFAQLSFDVLPKCVICERPSIDGLTHIKCRGKYTIDGVFSAVRYTKIPKKLLYQFKYQPYLSGLKEFLGELLYEALIQNEQFQAALKSTPLVVPIPLSRKKLRSRGYNQAELLGKEIAKRFSLQDQNILVRAKETKPQYGLKREERIENMKNAFGMAYGKWHIADSKENVHHSGAARSANSRIKEGSWTSQDDGFITALLIDDVVTTGSTLKEAANVLKRNGFEKVWGVTFAQD